MVKQTPSYQTVAQLKKLYPDRWVLLENPVLNATQSAILGGTFHYKHKERGKVYAKAALLGLKHTSIIYTGGQLDDINFLTYL